MKTSTTLAIAALLAAAAVAAPLAAACGVRSVDVSFAAPGNGTIKAGGEFFYFVLCMLCSTTRV